MALTVHSLVQNRFNWPTELHEIKARHLQRDTILLVASVPSKETFQDLCERLCVGWTASRSSLQHTLLNAIATALHTQSEVQEDNDSLLVARIDLSMVHFRGFSDVKIAIVGPGDHFSSLDRLRSSENTNVLIAVALTPTALEQSLAAWHKSYCLVLSTFEIIDILFGDNPLATLKSTIRNQYPKRFLMPYSQIGSAEFNMFKGRRSEMQQLWWQEDASFAVVGPSRIGKTSLLKNYRTLLIRRKDPRAVATFYVDLFESQLLSPDKVISVLAMHIDASRFSARLEAHQWDHFVRHLNARLGQRVTLLLDEVDSICGSDALALITMTAKRGLCRVVLSGRGALARLLVDPSQNAAHRYIPMFLGPLERSAAENLLKAPMEDMGIRFHSPDLLCRKILSFSGRLPFHIQFLGRQICERVFARDGDEVTADDIDAVFEEHMTSQLFTAPLYELAEPVARLMALRLLEMGKRSITEAIVSELASREGINLSLPFCKRVCDYLVIEQVLIWQAGSYAIANDALIHYFRRQRDRFDRLLSETRLLAEKQIQEEGLVRG